MLLNIKDILPELYDLFEEVDEKSINSIVYKYCRSFCKTMRSEDCVVLDPKSNFDGVDFLNHFIVFRSHRSGEDLIHKLRVNKIKKKQKDDKREESECL